MIAIISRKCRTSIDINHQDDSQVSIFATFRCQHFWGLVEVQIAATVATASYRNFSVATILGKAACLLSACSACLYSAILSAKIQSNSRPPWSKLVRFDDLKLWKYMKTMDFSSGSSKKYGYQLNEESVTGDNQTHPNLVQPHSQWGASLQLDSFCFLGDTGLLNPEAAYDAWHAAGNTIGNLQSSETNLCAM